MAKKKPRSIKIPPKSNPYKGLTGPVNPANPYGGMSQFNGRLYGQNKPAAKPGSGKSLPAPGGGGGAPPAPQTPAVMPWAGAIDSSVNNVTTGLTQRLNNITADELRTKQRFGIDDTSDPFSEMAMLRQSFDTAQKSSTNSMASQGQLYSGALQNSLDTGRFNFERGGDALKKSYADALAGFRDARLSAQTEANSQVDSLNMQRLDYALNNPVEDVGGQDPASGGGGGGAKGKTKLSKDAYLKGLRARTTESSRNRYRAQYTY